MIAGLIALIFGASQPIATPLCRIPTHALLVSSTTGIHNDILIYDRDDASSTCEIHFPGGAPPSLAITRDGLIYVAVRPQKETDYSTDVGHIDVISPDGRLLHRYTQGIVGPSEIQLDQ